MDDPTNAPDTGQDENQSDEKLERERTFTRRELLRAGWTVPVVTALSLGSPKTVYAQGPSHMDFADYSDHTDHVDIPHEDQHTDNHADEGFHVDLHGDRIRPNGSHADWHADFIVGHQDAHNDTHTDTHTDVSSHDDHLDHIDS